MAIVAEREEPADGARFADGRLMAAGLAVSLLLHALVAFAILGGFDIEEMEPQVVPIEVELVPAPEAAAPPPAPEAETAEEEEAAPEEPAPEAAAEEETEEETEQPEQAASGPEAEETEEEPAAPPETALQQEEQEPQEQPEETPEERIVQAVEEFGEEDTQPQETETEESELPPEEAADSEAEETELAALSDPAETEETPVEEEAGATEDTSQEEDGSVGEEQGEEETPPESESETEAETGTETETEEQTEAETETVPEQVLGQEEQNPTATFGTVGPIATDTTPTEKPEPPVVASRTQGGDQEGGQSAGQAPARRTDLRAASRLYSEGILSSTRAQTAMRGLGPGQRLNLLCMTELRAQLTEASPFAPELLPSFRPQSGTVLEPGRAAFKSGPRWFDLAFRCEVDEDVRRVEKFSFKIGAPIPPSQWGARGLPGG